MKKTFVGFSLLILILTSFPLFGSDVEWMSDFEEAQKIAAEKNLPILANFSGSDWCRWCIKLADEVFSKEAFKEYASEHVILFVADFPRNTKLPEKTAEQNEALAKKYGIRGLPTVLLLDKEGKLLGQTGYKPGGSEAYVTHLKDLLK